MNPKLAPKKLCEPLFFDGIKEIEDFLHLAKSLGRVIQAPDGEYIKSLRVVESCHAKEKTLSSRYGNGVFPFHTDTAFRSRPARIILLRAVSGDLQRATYVTESQRIIEGIPPSVLKNSAWICDLGSEKTFTTLFFEAESEVGFRYDPNCMLAMNRSARRIEGTLRERCHCIEGQKIEWVPNRVVAIPNWTYLHARGLSTAANKDRLLQRIYIE